MKKIKVLSLLLAAMTVLTAFSGCVGKDGDDNNGNNNNSNYDNNSTPTGAGTDSKGESPSANIAEGLSAEKIGTIDMNIQIDVEGNGGLLYQDENDKYGIMTFDGKNDTGAKYSYCKPLGNYFQVRTVDPSSITDAASLNSIGVVDATGKEIVPMKYATVDMLNERYIRVCEVTEQTTDKDEALVYYSDKMFSLTASDDDTLFKGNWYIYDVTTGKVLEGVTGTRSYSILAYGNVVKYVTDAKEYVMVNDKGEVLPDDADLFENGCYTLEEDRAGAVYNSDGKKLFDYSRDGFVPVNSEDDYIVAMKYGDSTYVLMDLSGNTVSADFSDRPYVYGNFIQSDNKLYDFKGNVVVEEAYNVYVDKVFGFALLLRHDNIYTLIKNDGTVLYQGTEDDTLYFDIYDSFTIRKKVDGKDLYYSLKDKDFTIEGSVISGSGASWLIKAETSDYTYDIIDVISGKTIIKDYGRYIGVSVPGSAIYVYAYNADGGIDIYSVK